MSRCFSKSYINIKFLIIVLLGLIGFVKIRNYWTVEEVTEVISNDCACFAENGKKYNFCYTNPSNLTMIGKRFDCKHMEAMQELGLLDPGYLDLSQEDMPDPQFVTAISANHIAEGRKQMNNLRSLWPERKIVVFDMGLDQYRKDYENDSLVDLRSFPFDKYPEYVKNMFEYRWKPIIIALMLKEFGAIFYMDSSIIFKDADLTPIYDLIRCRNRNYRITESHPKYLNNTNMGAILKSCNKVRAMKGMYDFLPISKVIQTNANMYEAGVVTVVRTKEAMDNIVKWYVLCALEEKCMSPPGAQLFCDFQSDNHQTEFANCHRYDQSAVNILSANLFNGDSSIYGTGITGYLIVDR